MHIDQVGGSSVIIIVAFIFICSILCSLLYYFKSKCKDDECTNLVNYDNWIFDSENNNNIIMKRKCNNNSSFFDGCSKIKEDQTTKTIPMNQWGYSSENNNNITLSRTCVNTGDCNIVPDANKTIIVPMNQWGIPTEDSSNNLTFTRTCTSTTNCNLVPAANKTIIVPMTQWAYLSEDISNNLTFTRTCTNTANCNLVPLANKTITVPMTQWAYLSEDISSNIRLNRTCTNTTNCNLVPDGSKNLIITPSLWSGTLDKDLSGTIIRTCTGNNLCSLVPASKQISASRLRKYPPILPVQLENNVWSASVTGAPYGNGIYTTTTSSQGWAIPVGILINSGRGSTLMYHSLIAYNATTGLPNTNLTTFQQGEKNAETFNNILGEWVGIQLPDPITLKAYRIFPRSQSAFYSERSPKEFFLYGSNDGTNWTRLDDRTGNKAVPDWVDEPQSFYIDNKVSYNRYRLHVTRVGNSAATTTTTFTTRIRDCVNIEKWEFFEEI